MAKYISLEELNKHIIRDGCDDGCGYIDERDIASIPTVDSNRIKYSIAGIPMLYVGDGNKTYRKTAEQVRVDALEIIDKYMGNE